MSFRSVRFFLIVVLGLLSVALVSLALEHRALRTEYAELLERALWPYPGMYVPSFDAISVDGALELTVGAMPDDDRQLIFVFTTTCPYCRASLPAWQRIDSLLGPDTTIAVLGVSLDGPLETRAYVSEHALRFPVVTFPDGRTRRVYRARTVPQVLVVGAGGRIAYVRRGSLDTGIAVDSVIHAARSVDGPAPPVPLISETGGAR